MKPKEFFSRWWKGIKTLSPLAQLKAKRVGIIGTMFGITMAAIVLTMNGAWYWIILGFFILLMQSIELIGTYQQIENARRVEKYVNLEDIK